MKAAVLKTFGSPLTIETVPDPVLGTGEVIVDVVASGRPVLCPRGLQRRTQISPGPAGGAGRRRDRAGARGRTRCDASRQGDWVFCDPTVRSRDDALSPDITLAGLECARRGRPAAAAAFPRRFVGRADARSHRECQTDRHDRRGGRRLMVQARHAAGALWRFPRDEIATRGNRIGLRRHRQFRQRRRGGRARHGRGLRRRARPQ